MVAPAAETFLIGLALAGTGAIVHILTRRRTERLNGMPANGHEGKSGA